MFPIKKTGKTLNDTPHILSVNGGSSGVKFALYRDDGHPTGFFMVKIDRHRIPRGDTLLDAHLRQRNH